MLCRYSFPVISMLDPLDRAATPFHHISTNGNAQLQRARPVEAPLVPAVAKALAGYSRARRSFSEGGWAPRQPQGLPLRDWLIRMKPRSSQGGNDMNRPELIVAPLTPFT